MQSINQVLNKDEIKSIIKLKINNLTKIKNNLDNKKDLYYFIYISGKLNILQDILFYFN